MPDDNSPQRTIRASAVHPALTPVLGGLARRQRRKQTRGAFLLLLGLTLLFAACSTQGDDTSEGADPDPPAGGLVVGFAAEPTGWSHLESAEGSSIAPILPSVIEPLLERTEDDALEPLLAESFDVSDDGQEYTFTIREARFHDGTDLSADDVVYSLEASRDSAISPTSAPFESVDAIEKLDDRTVRVTLSQPSYAFAEAMSDRSGMIIPEGSANEIGEQPVGTGPFVFSEWSHGRQVTLTRFSDYWGESPLVENVTWRFIADARGMLNALYADEIDLFYPPGEVLEEADDIESRGYTVGMGLPGGCCATVVLNAEEELFEDERVRQAIAHAIDRQAIADVIGITDEPNCLAGPATAAWHTGDCPYPYDPDRSRELLEEAGAVGLSLELKYIAISYGIASAEILAANLQDVGIEVDLVGRSDFAAWQDEVQLAEVPDFQVTIAFDNVNVVRHTCPAFLTRDCLPELDQLLAEANASVENSTRADLLQEAVELSAERAYLIPLTGGSQAYVSSANVIGFKFYPPIAGGAGADFGEVHIEEG